MKINKFLTTNAIICYLLLSLVACSPRSVIWSFEQEYCGTKIMIQNAGCSPCFQIASNKKMNRPIWLNSISGCEVSYRSSSYCYSFSIDEPFNANDVMDKIKAKLEEIYCD